MRDLEQVPHKATVKKKLILELIIEPLVTVGNIL
jgi:hypothetical protein